MNSHGTHAWDSSAYACAQSVPAWEPVSTKEHGNSVQLNQQMDTAEWPALGGKSATSTSAPGDVAGAAAHVFTGATSANDVSTGANRVNRVSVGSAQTPTASQEDMHMHAHHANSGVSGASEHSFSPSDPWARSAQACNSMHQDAARGVSTGGISVIALFSAAGDWGGQEGLQSSSNGGELTFAGALPGNLLEDSDLHDTPWDLPENTREPFGTHSCT